MVGKDLGISKNDVGASGMTAEQVIRAAIVKKIGDYTYRELAFHLANSRGYSKFCKIGIGKPFKKSALQRSIKSLSDETWEEINKTLIGYVEDHEKKSVMRFMYARPLLCL